MIPKKEAKLKRKNGNGKVEDRKLVEKKGI